MNNPFEQHLWSQVPYHFWSAIFFVLGSMVGSFLNVCIYRMPRQLSVITPGSHCPHCQHPIAWYRNIPLVSWVILRGKCAHCGASISARYLVVELLTALLFLGCWLRFGSTSAGLALAYAVLASGCLVATLIDMEHFIIPDEITLGGMGAGLLASATVPALHATVDWATALQRGVLGILFGAGVLYAIVRLGKLLFGRQRVELEPHTTIVFGETHITLPQQKLPYDDLFYRKTDTIRLMARHIELVDRCYWNTEMRLNSQSLVIGQDTWSPDQIHYMEVETDAITIPREAMGLGDVKFMGAIGAFLGWQATLFSLMWSSVIGALIGISLILAGKRDWSSRIPYGPYLALATMVWVFLPAEWHAYWKDHVHAFLEMVGAGNG